MIAIETIARGAAVALVLCGIGCCEAGNRPVYEPTYDQAHRLVREMEDVVGATGGWHKRPLAVRVEGLRNAERVVEQARKLFGEAPSGPFGPCWAAANGMRGYVSNLNDLALLWESRKAAPQPADYFASPFVAFRFGADHQACRALVEAIEAKGVSSTRR